MNSDLLYNGEKAAYTTSIYYNRRESMNEEEIDMVSKIGLKPSIRQQEKIKQNAIKLPVQDGKIVLDRKNPLHRMLMEENDEE